MRKITVFSTTNNNKQIIETSAATKGELQDVLLEKNIDSSEMKMIVKETKATLEHKDAVLPEGEFTLFLFPQKVKSGLDIEDIEAKLKQMRKEIEDMLEEIENDIREIKDDEEIEELRSEADELADELGL